MSSLEDLIWITKGKSVIDVSIYFYVDPEVTKISAIMKRQDETYVELGLVEHRLDSRWSIPSRAEMESYKKESAIYNFQSGQLMVNELLLSDCVISYHLEMLLFDGTEVVLERDSDGKLEPGALERLKSLHSGLYDTLYNKYCVEACIPT